MTKTNRRAITIDVNKSGLVAKILEEYFRGAQAVDIDTADLIKLLADKEAAPLPGRGNNRTKKRTRNREDPGKNLGGKAGYLHRMK